MDKSINMWLPTRPYSLIDAINRAAAAQGSFRYAMATSDADFNGHWVTIDQGFKPGWRAHYMWGGTRWLMRGATIQEALRAGLDEYTRGAKGCTVLAVSVPAEAIEYARTLGYVEYTEDIASAHQRSYSDDRWQEIGSAMMYERQLGCPAVGFLANSATAEEYKAKVDTFFAGRKRARAHAEVSA